MAAGLGGSTAPIAVTLTIHLSELKAGVIEALDLDYSSPAAQIQPRGQPTSADRWSVADGPSFVNHARQRSGPVARVEERAWARRRESTDLAIRSHAADAAAATAVDASGSLADGVHATKCSASAHASAVAPQAITVAATATAAAAAAAATAAAAAAAATTAVATATATTTAETSAEGTADAAAEGASITVGGFQPDVLPSSLFDACCRGNAIHALRLWLGDGGDINAREAQRGWTMLMGACAFGQRLVALELLQRGASSDEETRQGATALHFASMVGALKCVELLVEAMADVNAADSMGVTPLMSAALKEQKGVAEVLVRAGARSVVRGADGGVTRVARVDGEAGFSAGAIDAAVFGVQRVRRPTSNGRQTPGASSTASHSSFSRPQDAEMADEVARSLVRHEEAERLQQRGQQGAQHQRGAAVRVAAPDAAVPPVARCAGGRKKNKKGRAHTR